MFRLISHLAFIALVLHIDELEVEREHRYPWLPLYHLRLFEKGFCVHRYMWRGGPEWIS